MKLWVVGCGLWAIMGMHWKDNPTCIRERDHRQEVFDCFIIYYSEIVYYIILVVLSNMSPLVDISCDLTHC